MDPLTTFIQTGKLPELTVNVTIDNQSLVKLAGGILLVLVMAILIHQALSKHA